MKVGWQAEACLPVPCTPPGQLAGPTARDYQLLLQAAF